MSGPPDFATFDARHPEVWITFVAVCAEYRAAGHRRWSADAAMHHVRWGLNARIPNALVAYYARKYLAVHPDAKGFFTLCASMADAASGGQMDLGL